MSDEIYAEQPMEIKEFRAPGPVSRRLLNSNTRIRFIMGPQGSGKTTLLLFDALMKAAQMPPCANGDRYFHGVIIRDTYTNLHATTIRSWNKFFPKTMGEWKGGDGRPANHTLIFDNPVDGSKTHFSLRFTALQDQNIEDALRGNEFTWAYMNEADRINEDVLTFLVGRIGRYPAQDMFHTKNFKGRTNFFRGIVGDVNPPPIDSWIYSRFVESRPELHEWFQQPGGRSPNAENLGGLPENYYEEQVAANASKPWWIKRMVDGQFGYSRDGKPVYEAYDDAVHCSATDLKVNPELKLRLSFDQGITGPAMLLSQYNPLGQLRVLDEYCPGRMGAYKFGRNCRNFINDLYPGIAIRQHGVVDLAGMTGGVKEDNHLSWGETVAQALKIPLIAAESNELDPRIDGVEQLLTSMPAPGVPGLLISPRAKMLRKGFNSYYRFKKKLGQDGEFSEKPEKNKYSNPHDALQYDVMDLFGLQGIIAGNAHEGRTPGFGHNSGAMPPGYPQSPIPKPGQFNVFDMN